MKKILFILGLVMALLPFTSAQARTAGFGITAGMNISKINWKNVKEVEPQPEQGWYAGVMGMFSLPVLGFGFDGGVIYSQEGIDLGIQDIEPQTAQFISIPVHLRYDFKFILIEDTFIPYIYAGPQFNYAIKDLDFGKYENESLEAIIKDSNAWRLDLGLGCLLFDRLQVSYSYGIPMGEKIDVNLGETLVGNYKTGAHRIGLAYYF